MGHATWLGADVNQVVQDVCWFALYFLQGLFLFYGRSLISITFLPLSVLDQRAIKETSEAAPLPGC